MQLRNSILVLLGLIFSVTLPLPASADVDRDYWKAYPKLTEAFNQLYAKLPRAIHNRILYQHHMWRQANCKKTCEKDALEARIAFYKRQPISHGNFLSVFYEQEQIVPYSKAEIEDWLRGTGGTYSAWGFYGRSYLLWEMPYRKTNHMNSIPLARLSKIIEELKSEFDVVDPKANKEMSLTIEIALDNLATLKIDEAITLHGAAHGIYQTTYRHYRLDENRKATGSDFFVEKGSSKYAEFEKLIQNKASKKFAPEWIKRAGNKISQVMQKPDRWRFKKEGTTLMFQVYEVASFAEGIQELPLKWSEIDPYLSPFGKGIYKALRK
mgnify:CR=1 FL=1|tara:strand:+ start:686 stop:1657 length:972 start_codon:yes stop_codon:yes gene_type:complete